MIKWDFEKVFVDYDLIIGLFLLIVVFGIGENINDLIMMYMSDILMIFVNLVGFLGMFVLVGLLEGLLVGL